MIKRENYISKIRSFYDSDLIKVITGIRRCGKSIILKQIMDEIKEKSDNIIYLNFERISDYTLCKNYKELIDYINNNRKEGKCYIFLDEIQNVDEWYLAVKDLRLDNNSLFITGSNSKLLSSEILTYLSGRFVNFNIRPFVYKEIVEFSKELNIECSVSDYLIWGGMPGRFIFNNYDSMLTYLHDLEDTIIYNDLIKRYKIRNTIIFKKIVNYILINNSRIISARNICKYISNECAPVSINTVLKYIDYLKEAYIISCNSLYSNKAKKELVYFEKIYNTDVCFNSLSVINNIYDVDHNLENIVYNELIYRGYTLRVYKNNNKEIDFYAVKNGKEYFIQVAYSVVDPKAYNREFEAFKDCDPLIKKILITTDEFDYSTSIVKHINLSKFLNMDEIE